MSEMEIIIPHQKTDRWLPHWERYLKKIPKRGLNNLTKRPYWYSGQFGEWKGEATLPRRLRKICSVWIFSQAPPFFYYHMEMRTHGTEVENLEKAQEYTRRILERLEILYENMDTVTVLPPNEVEHWKEKIKSTDLYIRKQSRWIGLNLIQETEFSVIQSSASLKSSLLKEQPE